MGLRPIACKVVEIERAIGAARAGPVATLPEGQTHALPVADVPLACAAPFQVSGTAGIEGVGDRTVSTLYRM